MPSGWVGPGSRSSCSSAASQLSALTTAQSAACFRAQWDEPDYARLVLPSVDFYGAFGERVGLPG